MSAGIFAPEATCFANCSGLRSVTMPASFLLACGPFYDSDSETHGSTINVESLHLTPGTDGIIPDLGNNPYAPSKSYQRGLTWNCREHLSNVTLDEGITHAGSYAFYECSGITSLDLPATIVSIDEYAFAKCTGLSSIVFRGPAPDIASTAFTSVAADAFYTLSSEESWTSDLLTGYGGVLHWAAMDDTEPDPDPGTDYTFVLTLPAGLITIEEEAFSGLPCEAVIIPDGCTSIGPRAFADCASLVYAEIPSSVISIAEDAFDGCPLLTASP